MNKKFSTLMAGFLLAGALVTPTNLFAQIQYVGDKTYETVAANSTLPKANKSAEYFWVMNVEGEDYVITVAEGNKLVAKKFLAASMEDKIKISTTTVQTAFSGNNGNYEVSTGENKLGISNDGYDKFGTSATYVTGLQLTADKLGIKFGTAYITLDKTTFAWVNGQGEKTFAAKAVSTKALEKIENDRDVATELSFANNYILMVANQAIKGNADGTAELAEYAQVQENFWILEKVERGEHNAYALLKNKGTGKYLTINDKQAAVKLEWNATDKRYELADFSAMTLIDIISGDELPLVISGVEFSSFALCDVVEKTLSAEDLKTIFGDSFNAEMKRGNDVLANNPFTGNLKPVNLKKQNNGKYYSATVDYNVSGDEFMLQNGNGKIIAMQLTDMYANNSANTYGFKLVEVTPYDLALDLNQVADRRIYAPLFTIYATEAFAVGKDQTVLRFEVKDIDHDQNYVLGSLTIRTIPTLSAEIGGINYLDPITIKLGKFNTVDVKKLLAEPTFFTVTNKNTKADYSDNYGKVLSVNTYGKPDWVKAANALVGYPQSQWAITVNSDASVLTFKNRENPNGVAWWDYSGNPSYFTINASDLYKIKGETNVFAYAGDTIEIKPVETKKTDGFLRLDNYKNEMYHIGIVSSVWDGVAYVSENHKEAHQLGLITDVEAATNWKLAPAMYREWNSLGEQTVNRPDVLLVGATLSYWNADAGSFVTTDKDGRQTVFLEVLAYSMQNSSNKEYVMFDSSEGDGHYSTGTEDRGNKDEVIYKDGVNYYYNANMNYYAFKQVGADRYNIVEVSGNQGELSMNYNKMYGGNSANKGILNRTYKYDQTENDVFAIEVSDAAEYLKLNMGNVIKIFRDEYESNVLCEKGEFVEIGNEVEFDKINPALYVDTAYVDREGNNRWDYLLGVNIKRVDTTYKCNVPAHGIHRMDTTFGRFLVNLADSAIVEDERDNHSNKFVYDNGFRYARLGFVEGMHTHDSLVIASTKDTITVGAPEYSLAKFAFRIVDHAKKSFVIETGYKYPYKDNKVEEYPGYLRWINGNLVVTDNMDDAEVFSLKEDNRIPTDNETIAASEVVVIAGEGQVTIAGAAGKKVVISNILGQVVANTVLTSDHATVAAPQGVVVVAVEGEEAVKAIVK